MKAMSRILVIIVAVCLCIPSAAWCESSDMSGDVVIIYTANVRGDIDVYPKIAAVRDSFSERGAETVLLDAGNYLQGTVYATYDSGKSIMALMDETGYAAAAIGSHEFDFGTGTVGVEQHEVYYADDSFGKLAEGVSFAVISSNVMTGSSNDISAYPASALVNAGGLKIEILGLTDPSTPQRVADSNIEGMSFALPEGVLAFDEDSDITVVLSNSGLLDDDAADLVIDITEDSGFTVGAAIINTSDMSIETCSIELDGGENTQLRAAVNSVKEAVDSEYADGSVAKSQVVLNGAASDVRSGETNSGDLWTDALLWFATSGRISAYYDQDELDMGNAGIQVDSDHIVAIWNGGNLRDYLNTGDVTIKDLQRVLPYPNQVAVMYLSGAQLLEQLEAATYALPYTADTSAACASFPQVSGISYSVDTAAAFDPGEPYNDSWFTAASVNRVTIESVNGKPFDPDASYAVVTSNAIYNGMDAYYVSADKDPDLSTITSAMVVDVVWMYIQEELDGEIGMEYAEPAGRITVE